MTKDVLIQKCRNLGVSPSVDNTNEDLEQQLALKDLEYRATVHPYETTWIMNRSPMLAETINKIPAHNRDYIMDTWRASEKLDGVRATMVLDESLPPMFFTRGKNVDTLRPLAYSLKQFNRMRHEAALLDGELIFVGDMRRLASHFNITTKLNVRTATVAVLSRSELDPDITDLFPLTFVAFDSPPMYVGEFRQYDLRIENMAAIVNRLQDMYVKCVYTPAPDESNREFLARVLQNGGEGIVLKNPQGIYHWGKSRSHAAWVKVKAISGGNDFDGGTDIDGTITGFVSSPIYHNLVGAAIISDDDGNEIARISGFPLQTKLEMFVNPTKYIGKQITFQSNGETTAKNKKSHARFISWKESMEK